VSSSVGRATALLATGTMTSRVLGFAKSWLLLQAIGAVGFGADAYATSTIVPNSIYAIIAQGVLNAVLIPQIVRASEHADGGKGYINKLVTLGIVIFAGVAIVATALSPWLMQLFGLHGAQAELAAAFAYWSLPQIFFLGLYSLLGEVLNARKSFGPFTWAPVLNNVVGIAMLVIFIVLFHADPQGQRPIDSWTPAMIAMLAGGATLGIAVQGGVLFLFWRHVGLKYRPDFGWRGVNLGSAGRAAAWTFAMLLATQVAGLIETRVANTASGGNASTQTMTTSWLVFMLPHSIIAVSIVTAYYTRMAEHAHHRDIPSFRRDFSSALRSINLFIAFASAALIVVAYPFARVFTPHYVDMGNVLIAYLIGLVPFCAVFVMQRAFYSLGDTRSPFFLALVQTVLIIIGVLVCLTVPDSIRAASIALVVSISGGVQAILAALMLRRRIHGIDGRRLVSSMWRFITAAVISGIVGVGVLVLLGGTFAGGFAVSGFFPAIVSIAIIGVVMLLVYLALLRLLRTRELSDALTPVLARLRRRA
jgi:putative peptidoglycan lipid II flippase